jgi:hypothetical protein
MVDPRLLSRERELTTVISFNDDRFRRHSRPLEGEDDRGKDFCLFDGYVAEEDNMTIALEDRQERGERRTI